MGILSEIDRLAAIEKYKDASARYTDIEIDKGWRAESYFKIGAVYSELMTDPNIENTKKESFRKTARVFLEKAKNEYSRIPDQTDERTKNNIEEISKLLLNLGS